WYLAGRWFSKTSGGSTTWSSTLTRIRSSLSIGPLALGGGLVAATVDHVGPVRLVASGVPGPLEAAVDVEHLAADVAAPRAPEHHQRPGLLDRGGVAADRADGLVDHLLGGEVLEGRHHRGVGGAGVDAVDPDTVGDEVGVP